MTAHKHAALMLQYAQDALETEHPELLWERRRPGEEWQPFDKGRQPSWDTGLEYRRNPKTLTYTVTIPEPLRKAPKAWEKYYFSDIMDEELYGLSEWDCEPFDLRLLKRGLCFATKEDAIAAAKAMLPIKGEEA